jgi:hypothetical protein
LFFIVFLLDVSFAPNDLLFLLVLLVESPGIRIPEVIIEVIENVHPLALPLSLFLLLLLLIVFLQHPLLLFSQPVESLLFKEIRLPLRLYWLCCFRHFLVLFIRFIFKEVALHFNEEFFDLGFADSFGVEVERLAAAKFIAEFVDVCVLFQINADFVHILLLVLLNKRVHHCYCRRLVF